MSLIYVNGGGYDWYYFSMRYGYFEGVEIVEGGGASSIAPGGAVTLETVVRNTGNTVRTLDVEIVALGDDGSIISNPGGYFFLDNWRHKRKGIDLTMRMMKSYTTLFPSIFKRHNI